MFVVDTLTFSKNRTQAHVQNAEYEEYTAPCCPKKAAKAATGNFKAEREIITKIMKTNHVKGWKIGYGRV
jgi:hypothetical protein